MSLEISKPSIDAATYSDLKVAAVSQEDIAQNPVQCIVYEVKTASTSQNRNDVEPVTHDDLHANRIRHEALRVVSNIKPGRNF
jgi:hypothetical protein